MSDRQRSQPRSPARGAAVGALLLTVLVIAYVALSAGSAYQVRLLFRDASGLVPGDQVMIGPSTVGSVRSISLTGAGRAAVVVGLEGDAAPLHRGTVARIEANGLAGIASHYVTLQPAPAAMGPALPSGATIPARDTHPEVGLDQLFNTLDAPTRAGLRGVIRGEAQSIRGRVAAARRTLEYLDPLLQSTSRLTAALDRDEPAFDRLLVQGAQTMRLLAARSTQLTDLVGTADAVTGVVAGQAHALQTSLGLLPSVLRRSTGTFAGLRRTVGALEPLVAAAKPQVRRLAPFAAALERFATAAAPTLGELAALIAKPTGDDLTTLLRAAPTLARAARTGFPAISASIAAQTASGQLAALRVYAPDVVAALANTGALNGYYDANGHYGRAEPFYGAYGISGGTLTNRAPDQRYSGLTVARSGRCPGGATQPADASMPQPGGGCPTSTAPAGP